MPPKWPTEVCEDKEYAQDELWHLYDGSQEVTQAAMDWVKENYPYVDDYGNFKLITKSECRHAEIAALEKVWNKPNVVAGACIFVSHSPCKNCGIKLFTAGITKVYYRHNYRSNEGLEYLRANGVEVEQIQETYHV